MTIWTVIAVYDSNGQVYQNQCRAKDAFEAIEKIASAIDEADRDDLQFVGAIAGDITLQPPCECSGTTAYASDLAEIAEDA